MPRVMRASIVFDFDIDELESTFGTEFSDEDAEEYVLETFMEDMYTFIKYNEIREIIKLELVNA